MTLSNPEKRSVAEDFPIRISYDDEDVKLLRKVDLRLLPILTLLYLLSFLDRTNVGNVNLKQFDPQLWLPLLTFAWGVASVAQGLVTNQAGLFGIRILLGATEAGLFPGVVFIFSVYYLRRERHWRVAIFFAGAALAGAFGGVLAYAIGKMGGAGGKHEWEWIFILGGLLTIAVSAVAFFFVPTWPQKAKWLSDAERSRLLARLDSDCDAARQEMFSWKYVRQAFLDPLIWGYALLFHGFAFVLYTLSLFMPTIIADLGLITWKAQLMTVPPNALAFVGIAFGARLAAWTGRRASLIIGSAVVAIIGTTPSCKLVLVRLSSTLCRLHRSSHDHDTCVVLVIDLRTPPHSIKLEHSTSAYISPYWRFYTGNALLLSWPAENISGQTKRAVGVALQITVGDPGAVTGVLLYRPTYSTHRFRKPHIIAIAYLTLPIVVAGGLWFGMARENRRRAEIIAAGKDEEVDYETKGLLDDRDVHWRYTV